MPLNPVEERRTALRVELPGRVEIAVPHLPTRLEASSLNLSERGICVRLQETLEVRSDVRLRLFVEAARRPVECDGRVAWVVQRLDLRDAPPFLYDVGLEFVKPSPRLRQFAARIGVLLRPSRSAPTQNGLLQPVTIRQRCYVPRLKQEPAGIDRWHLVVTVDGAPCVSARCASTREAIESWQRFKRRIAKSSGSITQASRSRRGKEVSG